ncbi:MAG: Calx-beta domain-containing protein, partial [Candidatus Bipolaricaulota bacterium]
LEFGVSLTNQVTETVTVQYYTVDDTAVSGEDYEGVPETSPLTLTFQPGETEKTITIDTVEDISGEENETFRVILENATGTAVILDGEGVGTILDDDPPAGTGGGGEAEREQAGAAGEAETTQEACTPICPPAIPLMNADKTDDISVDKNGNGMADAGDVIKYEVVIDNVAESSPENIRYLEPISPHLEIVRDSLSSNSGVPKLVDVGEAKLLTVVFREEENSLNFPLNIRYQAKVKEALPEGIGYIGGQGVVYSSNYPTAVTNDPDTAIIDDPTRTRSSSGSNASAEEIKSVPKDLKLEKSLITRVSDEESPEGDKKRDSAERRFLEEGTAIKFGINIENNSGETIDDPRLVNPVGRHLSLNPETIKLGGKAISPQYDEGTGVFSLKLPSIAPGESLFITYLATFTKQEIPDNLGYIGSRAYLVRNNGPLQLSDDPDSSLFGDRTAVLLPASCSQDNYMDRWDRWLKTVKEIESGIFPLVFSSRDAREPGNGGNEEKEIDDGLNWVMIGERSKDQLDSEGTGADFSSQFESGTIQPNHSFLGTAEFDLEPNFGQLFIGRKANSSPGGRGGSEGEANTDASIYAQGFEGKTTFKQIAGKGELTPLTSSSQSEEIRWCGKGYIPLVSGLDSESGIDLEKVSDDFLSLISIEGNKSDF